MKIFIIFLFLLSACRSPICLDFSFQDNHPVHQVICKAYRSRCTEWMMETCLNGYSITNEDEDRRRWVIFFTCDRDEEPVNVFPNKEQCL